MVKIERVKDSKLFNHARKHILWNKGVHDGKRKEVSSSNKRGEGTRRKIHSREGKGPEAKKKIQPEEKDRKNE